MDASSSQAAMAFMDNDLYTAAVNGRIETFNGYHDRLHLLLTPNKNTVLHVYLAKNRLRIRICILFLVYFNICRRCHDSTLIRSDEFVRDVLDMCPTLLLKPNAKGEIPLHIEARFGHLPIIQLLIERANRADEERDIENGMEPVKQMLRATDNEENMALHIAARYGHLQIAQRLIEEDPHFVYPANRSGETPLFIAARRGYHRLVTAFLDNSQSVAYGGPDDRTALHAAVMARSRTTVRVILEKKRNLAKRGDRDERTPLHYAAHLGYPSIVKLLLESDKSAAYKMDKEKLTPLLMAARQGDSQIMKEIIKRCPDCCELVDGRGWNFLHFAVVSLPLCPLQELLRAQEFINFMDEKDIHGNTPLHVLANSRFYPGYVAEAYKHDKVRLGEIDLQWHVNGLITSKKQKEIFEILEDIGQGEVAGAPVRPLRKNERDLSRIDKARENHSVVAALIAALTFAAAFNVTGGYKSEKCRDAGTVTLSHDLAFVLFIITDAIAMISSILALFLYFASSRPNDGILYYSYVSAFRLINVSLETLVVAFVTGTYAVLQPSGALAIVIYIIGLSFFLCKYQLIGFKRED